MIGNPDLFHLHPGMVFGLILESRLRSLGFSTMSFGLKLNQ